MNDRALFRHAGRSQRTRLLTFRTAAQVVGSVADELVTIPVNEEISFNGDLRDWCRVSVEWRGTVYVIARAAWEAAQPRSAKQARVDGWL